jgi:flagellar basal body rod protein FlgG
MLRTSGAQGNAVDVMAIASIGMQADLARMESISHNTANVLTPGLKRQISVTSGFAAQVQQGVN